MDIIEINNKLLASLHEQAEASERKRMYYDLRTSPNDGGQRMLNVLLPGTKVPIHRHPNSNENVLCLSGKLVEVLEPSVIYEAKDGKYGEDGTETWGL